VRHLILDHLTWGRHAHVPPTDAVLISDPRFRDVMEQAQSCGPVRVRALLHGDDEGQDAHPEAVLCD
jgi:hypothetical protein